GTWAGSPSMIPVSASPWDSPAVSHLNIPPILNESGEHGPQPHSRCYPECGWGPCSPDSFCRIGGMLRWLTAGESHGEALTGIIEGLPAHVPITRDDIRASLARRRLGYGRGA